MEIKFFNTMSRRNEVFQPLEPGKAKLYTCGPTVYNYAHIGNFRAYIFEDILRRVMEYFGLQVTHVMNLTDVDDKTIRDSRKAGVPLRDFTRKYKDAFFEDVKTLNILPATIYPAATDHIPEMIALIEKLFERGYAYQASDKCVYFSIDKFKQYGNLAHIDRENQRAGVRINADEYAKDSVADFALWKAHDDQDGDVKWPSPWGEGRPGWHIECSAMSMKYLGEQFDLHTGGVDNMFPHHEDEIAQSEAATGKKWVNYWLHCEHLMVDGGKMSKSLGNFFTLRDLLAKGWTGREIRWVLMSVHYRRKLNFSFSALEQAREALKRFDDFARRLHATTVAGDGSEVAEMIKTAVELFERSIADDLNLSGAIAALYDLSRAANKLADDQKLSQKGAEALLDTLRKFDKVFAVLNVDNLPAEETFPPEIIALAEQRATARAAKNFAESDRLRDEIKAQGYIIEDAPKNTWKLKRG